MAVVQSYESIADRSASGVIRESPTYRRSFVVRVDNPATSLKEIGAAPGINYGDQHPDDPTTYVTNIEVSAKGDSMMLYQVDFQYGLSKDATVTGGAAAAAAAGGGGGGGGVPPPDPLALPYDYWSGSSSLYSIRRQIDNYRNTIANTAGVPIAGGVEDQKVELQLILNKFYAFDDFASLQSHCFLTGAINSEPWPNNVAGTGSDPYGWRLSGASWNFRQQVSDTATLNYYEGVFTFSYRTPMPLDWTKMRYSSALTSAAAPPAFTQPYVTPWCPWIASKGYTQLKDGGSIFNPNDREAIRQQVEYRNCDNEVIVPPSTDDNYPCEWPTSEPVSEPAALDVAGKAASQASPPAIVIADVIHESKVVDFHAEFGSPPTNQPSNPDP
jgi:hypothetical protein